METWDAIRARRNVRTYTPDPVPEADLLRIAEAAWRAPSASNRQHWDFVIVTDRGQLAELSTVWRGARHIAGASAAIALVIPQYDDDHARLVSYYDLGQATYAIMVAAANRPPRATASARVTPRSASRRRPARSSACPTIMTWPSSSASATRPTGRCAPSSSRTAARSTRWSAAATGSGHW
jgi:nitroreductase